MKAKYYLMMVIAVGFFSIAAQKANTAGDIVGTWRYMISGVPAEYETGLFTFEQKESKTVGYMESTEKTEMKDLMIDQGKVTFSIESSQAGLIKYSFVQTGDTLTGQISSQYGDFPMKAVKEAKN